MKEAQCHRSCHERPFRTLGTHPKAVESATGYARVVHGMLWIAVAKVVLDKPEIVALVSQVESAGVP